MRKCTKCQSNLEDNVAFCPLCGAYCKGAIGDAPVRMNPTAVYGHKIKIVTAMNRILLIAALLVIIGGIVDLCLRPIYFGRWWLIYALTGLLVVQITVVGKLKRSSFNWRDIIDIVFTVMLYILFIDWYSTQLNGFSLSFVIPGITVAGVLVLCIFCLMSKISLVTAMQAQLTANIINVLFFVLTLILKQFFGYDNIFLFPAIIALITQYATVLLALVIRHKDVSSAITAQAE